MKKIHTLLLVLFLVALTIGCSNDSLLTSIEPGMIDTGFEYEENLDDQFLEAMRNLQGRGGFGDPDFDREGQFFLISKKGSSCRVSFQEAIAEVKSSRWIDVNGSGTSLQAAIESTISKAKYLQVNMVLVYIAQGLDYWNAEDSVFKQSFRNLIYYTSKDKTKINVISHSWSGHIVMNQLVENPYVTHFTINPAHGNFKDHEMVSDYVFDINRTVSPTYILGGTSDLVSQLGGGVAFKDGWHIVGYNSVYKGAQNNSKVSIITIDKATHLMTDMMDKGAFEYVKKYAN